MNYTELLDFFTDSGMDYQTAQRLTEAIMDAGGVNKIKSLLSECYEDETNEWG